jgi:high-affinity Fe2+/Pb2+ permease
MKSPVVQESRRKWSARLNLAGFGFSCVLMMALVVLFALNLRRHLLDWSFLLYFIACILTALVFWRRLKSARELS